MASQESPPVPADPKTLKYDLTISFSTADEIPVRRIEEFLKKKGLIVWVKSNSDQSQSKLLADDRSLSHGHRNRSSRRDANEACLYFAAMESVAQAMQQSELVLACISDSFKHSNTCRAEVDFALACQKPILTLIVREAVKIDGWLQSSVGSKVCADAARFDLEEAFTVLMTEVDQQRLSRVSYIHSSPSKMGRQARPDSAVPASTLSSRVPPTPIPTTVASEVEQPSRDPNLRTATPAHNTSSAPESIRSQQQQRSSVITPSAVSNRSEVSSRATPSINIQELDSRKPSSGSVTPAQDNSKVPDHVERRSQQSFVTSPATVSTRSEVSVRVTSSIHTERHVSVNSAAQTPVPTLDHSRLSEPSVSQQQRSPVASPSASSARSQVPSTTTLATDTQQKQGSHNSTSESIAPARETPKVIEPVESQQQFEEPPAPVAGSVEKKGPGRSAFRSSTESSDSSESDSESPSATSNRTELSANNSISNSNPSAAQHSAPSALVHQTQPKIMGPMPPAGPIAVNPYPQHGSTIPVPYVSIVQQQRAPALPARPATNGQAPQAIGQPSAFEEYTRRTTRDSTYRSMPVHLWTNKDVLDFLFDSNLQPMMPLCESMVGQDFTRFSRSCQVDASRLYDQLNAALRSRFQGLTLPMGTFTQFLTKIDSVVGPAHGGVPPIQPVVPNAVTSILPIPANTEPLNIQSSRSPVNSSPGSGRRIIERAAFRPDSNNARPYNFVVEVLETPVTEA